MILKYLLCYKTTSLLQMHMDLTINDYKQPHQDHYIRHIQYSLPIRSLWAFVLCKFFIYKLQSSLLCQQPSLANHIPWASLSQSVCLNQIWLEPACNKTLSIFSPIFQGAPKVHKESNKTSVGAVPYSPVSLHTYSINSLWRIWGFWYLIFSNH